MSKRKASLFQDYSYVIVFILLVVYTLISVSSSSQPTYEQLIEIEVSAGDTLWAIASKHTEGIPVPVYIELLKTENNLIGHSIYPGQKLLVPKLEAVNESSYVLSNKQ